MQSTRTFTDRLFLVIKGLGMGAANKVPGVSGGVVAFVAGFYEEFIYSLQKVNKTAFKLFFNGRFKSFFHYINGRFLSLLFLGMIVSYFSISKILDYFLIHSELYVWSLFFGMIIGSIYYINKDFNDWNYRTILSLAIGILLGVGISFLDPAKENDNLFFVFFCGIISVSGMTLPGFSGSFILILLGNYVLLLVDSVNALSDTFYEIIVGDFSVFRNSERITLLNVLLVFTLGSVTGLVTFSHILSYILKHYKSITTASIIGFIVGSLGVVWPWKNTVYRLTTAGDFIYDSTGKRVVLNYERFIPNLNSETYLAIAYIAVGIAIVLTLEWYGNRTRKVDV
jgi:putative membrane protein